LIEDARQLAEALESAHPEPYSNGGGKIAFHRRLHRLLNAIPEGGMTREEFIRLLRPFVAAVGDAHTELWSDYSVDTLAPGGVPLQFGIVEESLYVTGVPNEENRDLIGATLVSVERVPLAELCERQRRLQGTENRYHALYLLATQSLWYRPYMEELLPEWQDSHHVSVELQLPSGESREVVFDLPRGMGAMLTPESRLTLPAPDSSGFLYDFLDTEGKTAYLRIDHMSRYREAEEMRTGSQGLHLRSATKTFRSMVVEMEQAGTDTLIIDLRKNRGGSSFMGDILTYFLYGKAALQDIMVYGDSIGGGMVRKYSELFWEQTQSWTSLEQVNEGRALPLRADDYDFAGFTGDLEWSPARKAEAIAHSEEAWLARSPTFWEEYQSEAYGGYYRPGTVVVLIDSETFSSGFNMATYLYLAGATLVGTPSGQAANSFGNGQLWRLDHTRFEGTVSTSYSVAFPDDSEMARVLPVDYPLTYSRLASYGFDPNAEVLYALELLPQLGETARAPGAAEPEQEPKAQPPEAEPQPTATAPARTRHFSRAELIEDVRQLAGIVENAHPDPYLRGGGRIAFHYRLHRLLNAIPAEGMTRDGFVHLLSPFVAAVGDGHTGIWDGYRVSDYHPGGVPLRFGIVEESLYVSGVRGKEDSDLIGALLISVEGVPVAELCERQERLKGTENPYHALQLLARLSLWYRPFMEDLLPEWQDERSVSVELQLPNGENQELVFELPVTMSSLHSPESSVTLPATGESGFLYSFVDADGKIAYLRVDHMLHYREAYEVWALAGSRQTTEQGHARPKSATETFRDLVVEMKEAGTETLIVDLRDNEGGHSLMSDILLYFLYGKEDFIAVKTHTPAAGGGEIRRYSHLYFESCSSVSIEDYNKGRAVPLIEGDYCFDDDFTDDEEKVRGLFQESETPAFLVRWLDRSPTFYAEYESGTYSGYYRPERILVLVNPGTYSSGFTMARHLYLAGATLVGTPPAQASNCFGESIPWILKHTRIGGVVSVSYYNQFPNDPVVGRVLPVHYPLSYDKLAAYGFDPNAEYLYALELLPGE
jgi:C-terminal processing protease CtpA/Prc